MVQAFSVQMALTNGTLRDLRSWKHVTKAVALMLEARVPVESGCWKGKDCTRKDCRFKHAGSTGGKSAKGEHGRVCMFGLECTDRTCHRAHPEDFTGRDAKGHNAMAGSGELCA